MHHAYKDGYSVLPKLKRLEGRSPFQFVAGDRDAFAQAKREATRQRRCEFEHDLSAAVRDAVSRFLVDHYPVPLDPPHTLDGLALQMQEDLAVVCTSVDRDWAAALHVCLPSRWRPEERIGRPFAEIHSVVPGMRLANARQLVETMIHSGPFERFVWGIQFDDRLDNHPSQPLAEFDPAHPRVFVRVERQVTIGFPALGAALFLIRPHVFPEHEIDRPALVAGLRQMSPEQRTYKGVSECFEELIRYLEPSRGQPGKPS